jgi:cysteine desulfurase
MDAQPALVGNPSSLHAAGRRARRLLEEGRETVASALGARPGEVIVTAGGTESDNLAVKGLFWARRGEDPRRRRVVASAVEHHAVLDPVSWLRDAQGADVVWLPVDPLGRVDPSDLRRVLAEDPESTALVSVMWANNEVGTLEPVAELAAVAAEFGVPLHTDAVQAVGTVPVDVEASGVAALSLSAHKFGGPVGVGALVLRRGVTCAPLTHGGGQERDVRSGTLDVRGVVGMAAALQAAVDRRAEVAADLTRLRDRLVRGVLAAVPDAVPNGDPEPAGRLPGIAHFSFPGCEGDALLMLLDARGIECSTGSACCGSPWAVVRPTPTSTPWPRRSDRWWSGPVGCQRPPGEGARRPVRRGRFRGRGCPGPRRGA